MIPQLHDFWNEVSGAAMGLVFDDTCVLCRSGRSLASLPGVCDSCLQALPRLGEPRCAICSEWFLGSVPGPFRCLNCRDRSFSFEFAAAGFQARVGVRDLVHQYKYGRQLWLAETLGALLAPSLAGPLADPRLAGEDWWLVPVPLHPRRQRERGFNQAGELAGVLARLTGRPVSGILARTRYTTVQASLTREDRLENLRGAFRMVRSWPWARNRGHAVAGRAVLLLDDVFTTGATIDECARVLRRDGRARRVAALTLARG
jgi:competence protein ComFC